jgi:tyrosine-protein kinase Etk/Wzc
MQTVNELSQDVPVETTQEDSNLGPKEFDILDVILILAARKVLIVFSSLAGLLLAIILVLLVKPSYTAKATILPPQPEQSSSSALLGQFGALASMSGLGSSLGLKNPSDLYIGILQSQSVTDALVKRFHMMERLHPKYPSQARLPFEKGAKFTAEKDGMISITFVDKDPREAAAVCNAYIDELYKLNNRLALGAASQRRLFFEQQLAQEKDRLADAEVALKKTEEATGIIAPSGQTENIIRQVSQIQAEITEREVELNALRTSSTDQNPDVIRLNTELSSLRSQLADFERGAGAKHNPGDISIATANVPQAGLEYIRKERDLKYHQLLFDLLARQYEAARMDEAKAAPVIQVVDPALVPDKKSAPFRALWAIVGLLLGFFLSTGYALANFVYYRLAADERQGRRLALLRQELSLRR